MDAEPVAIVIDDIPSSRGQSSVQHDQGLPGGKKREGEPNPGQQDAKKPRLDNGASPAFVHKTVATVAVDSSISQSAIHFRNVPARTNVTRAVGSNTTWAAQPQQLLGKEELRKMVEEKVAHCTAKANSQMKQLQDRVAKLTKVFKGWEEYAWKFQQQQQPTAQVLSSQRSGGSTSAPNPAVTAAASRQQVVPKPPVPTYNQPPFVQRVSMATEAVGPQTSMQPTNPNVTIVQPPTQARRNTVKDLIGAQRAGPPQPQVATAPKPPPPQPVAQQQVGSAPPTRQKPPEKARVPSQDTANVNAVIDLTEDAEETTNSQASGRKPSGAGPPPLLKAVSEPSPPPNTVAPAAQARPTSQVCPFNNPQQAAPVSVNTSRKVSEVLQAIMNTARNIQAPPNFRTVTTSVQQVGQSLHTLPSTAPTYRRPPLQSSVGYVGGQPVVPHVQQRTGTFRPPDVTTSTYVVQPQRHPVHSVGVPPARHPMPQTMTPYRQPFQQPQRHPVHSVGVPPARHPMPYRQPFQQVRPPASMMQAPRPTGPPILSRPAPPPLLHSNNPPQQLRPQIAGLPLPHRTTLQIARVGNIIALTWDVSEPPNPRSPTLYCYQLFAYQEGTGQPNTALWKKIGDVKALPLPMACTLTNFLPRGTYHFAVRAMDVYSTVGPFSAPCSIDLSSA
ncbi:PREDICTED: activating transcription factor 7-interacting protein 1-like [Branchiostoma belcheri]|uniref:Activating transcription factor 7-interacting protein 1-like n=1 Tax=Branchiostoma belcheri TaxID=7741 RepID=A0A6P4YWE8_BRABE|nr:PREDICTED: activating transcription factor 7-interacting protein 1-like [Branchiostoma belcheri]